MSDANADTGGKPAKRGKSKLLLIACLLSVIAGGGGFYAVYSGLLKLPFGGGDGGSNVTASGNGSGEGLRHGQDGSELAGAPGSTRIGGFVPLDPIVVSLGAQSHSSHLKVMLTVEVDQGREAEVEFLKPRLADVLNGFLRAVDEREFELPQSMERLRAQMLRRVRLVTPEGAVRDLLIQEFLLN